VALVVVVVHQLEALAHYQAQQEQQIRVTQVETPQQHHLASLALVEVGQVL
jgi:hypothetical protein